MSDDESYSYEPEVEATYTDTETEEALKFIKENNLPMSDLLYALRFIRIGNRDATLDDKFIEIEKRLKKLRNKNIVFVKPPSEEDVDEMND